MRSSRLRLACDADAEVLAPLLRAADAAEVRACGREPLAAIQHSLEQSEVAGALELDGELGALFGVCLGPRDTALGPRLYDIAWCLTGRAVDRFPVAFMRASRTVIADFLAVHPVLANYIDARYSAALRWAARLGAEVCPPVEWGASKELFHPCIWRA